MIRVQPLNEVPTPESVGDSVNAAIDRALEQRPDLQAEVAGIRVAERAAEGSPGRILSKLETREPVPLLNPHSSSSKPCLGDILPI